MSNKKSNETVSAIEEAVEQAREQQKEKSFFANLFKDYKITNQVEKSYYHVVLINPLTDEFGNFLERPNLVKLMPQEYQEQQKVNFYGYAAKVLHDPTITE